MLWMLLIGLLLYTLYRVTRLRAVPLYHDPRFWLVIGFVFVMTWLSMT